MMRIAMVVALVAVACGGNAPREKHWYCFASGGTGHCIADRAACVRNAAKMDKTCVPAATAWCAGGDLDWCYLEKASCEATQIGAQQGCLLKEP